MTKRTKATMAGRLELAQAYERRLNIHTLAVDPGLSQVDFHYHRNEPTDYQVLERLTSELSLSPSDHLVDVGCGRGRALFFIQATYHCQVTGIEGDPDLFKSLKANQESYLERFPEAVDQVHLVEGLAEEYLIQPVQSHFYFFNPFTVHVFKRFIYQVQLSIYQTPRSVTLILYYPHPAWEQFLQEHTEFRLYQRIPLTNYSLSAREAIALYQQNPA